MFFFFLTFTFFYLCFCTVGQNLVCNVDRCSALYTALNQAVPWEYDASGNVCCPDPSASTVCPQTQQEVQ